MVVSILPGQAIKSAVPGPGGFLEEIKPPAGSKPAKGTTVLPSFLAKKKGKTTITVTYASDVVVVIKVTVTAPPPTTN